MDNYLWGVAMLDFAGFLVIFCMLLKSFKLLIPLLMLIFYGGIKLFLSLSGNMVRNPVAENQGIPCSDG